MKLMGMILSVQSENQVLLIDDQRSKDNTRSVYLISSVSLSCRPAITILAFPPTMQLILLRQPCAIPLGQSYSGPLTTNAGFLTEEPSILEARGRYR
jgi:hypothetical protein